MVDCHSFGCKYTWNAQTGIEVCPIKSVVGFTLFPAKNSLRTLAFVKDAELQREEQRNTQRVHKYKEKKKEIPTKEKRRRMHCLLCSYILEASSKKQVANRQISVQ